jgi:hypothetical protein
MRLTRHFGADEGVAEELYRIAQKCTEVEDAEDIFWRSLSGCLNHLIRNPKLQPFAGELHQLSTACLAEANRLMRAL